MAFISEQWIFFAYFVCSFLQTDEKMNKVFHLQREYFVLLMYMKFPYGKSETWFWPDPILNTFKVSNHSRTTDPDKKSTKTFKETYGIQMFLRG